MPARTSTPEDEALEFLDALFAGVEDGWLSLFSVDRSDDGGSRPIDWADLADPDQVDQLVATAMDRARTSCVWFGVATRRENLGPHRRGGKADCVLLPALFADVDVAGEGHEDNDELPKTRAEAVALIDAFPLAPTVLIDTGGGFQAWWFFDEPLEAQEANEMLERWACTWAQLAGGMA